ncbi:MAG: tetratricopeptide repeat protein [Anaerolineae bacterium]|nr:tetratricopeptide repeat protein [Anaerolineae bacterium]
MLSTSDLQERVSPSGEIWDVKHFKALLGLPRFPLRFLQEEPWQSWIEQRGGLGAVRGYLLTDCNLSPDQQELLQIVFDDPGAPTQYYSDRLNISPSTFFRQIIALAHIVISYLNAWELRQPLSGRAGTTNLPALLNPLIGVDELLKSAFATLKQPDVRLLTITGPGGVGKTHFAIHLAIQLSDGFKDGAYLVSLASVNDGVLLLSEVMRVLRVEGYKNQPSMEALKAYLRERTVLLLLDSFDHLSDVAPTVVELLWQAPGLKIIVTSREMLRLSGEHRFRLPLLAVPDLEHLPRLEQLEQYPSIRLFIERARAVQPSFELTEENATAVAEICCRLDGLPLAIELAAARSELFPPQQMLRQMQHRLEFLKSSLRDKEIRHQTLRNTIDWSYTLLDEEERKIFRRLAIFAHEWSLEAAQVVCDVADAETHLEALVRKSLVQCLGVDEMGSVWFQMLQTIHDYASRQMEDNGETQTLQRRHAAYYISLLKEAREHSFTPRLKEWTSRIKQEHNNIRIALTWALAEEPETALQMIEHIWNFWEILNLLSEGLHWAERALSQTRHLKTPTRARVLQGTGWLALPQHRHEQAEAYFSEALLLARELGDTYLLASALQGTGEILRSKRDYEQARAMYEESLHLSRELGDKSLAAWALDHLGYLAWRRSEAAQARVLLEEALALFEEMGYQWGVCIALDHLGRALLDMGEYKQAQACLERSLPLLKEYGTRWHFAWTLSALGWVMLAQGDYERAGVLYQRSLSLHRDVENPWGVMISLMDFSNLFIAQANYVDAVRLSSAVYARLGEFEATMLSETAQLKRDMEVKIWPVAKEHLDEETYHRAWAEGQIAQMEDLIAELKERKFVNDRESPDEAIG